MVKRRGEGGGGGEVKYLSKGDIIRGRISEGKEV